jgi:hypothetical protein
MKHPVYLFKVNKNAFFQKWRKGGKRVSVWRMVSMGRWKILGMGVGG